MAADFINTLSELTPFVQERLFPVAKTVKKITDPPTGEEGARCSGRLPSKNRTPASASASTFGTCPGRYDFAL